MSRTKRNYPKSMIQRKIEVGGVGYGMSWWSKSNHCPIRREAKENKKPARQEAKKEISQYINR